MLFRENNINSADIADYSPVPKDGETRPRLGVDRQIIDRRRRNTLEERLITGCFYYASQRYGGRAVPGEGRGLKDLDG